MNRDEKMNQKDGHQGVQKQEERKQAPGQSGQNQGHQPGQDKQGGHSGQGTKR